MKHSRKLSIFCALLFILVCTGIQAQKFDIDEFHIPDGRLNLSDSEYERLKNTGKQLREKLVTDLQAQGYDVISPRRSKIRLKRVGIDDIRVDYDPEAKRVIFGKIAKVGNSITVNAYLYSSENGIRTSHEPLETTTLSRQSHELNDSGEISTAVNEIIKGLSLNKPEPPPAPIVVEPQPEPITPKPPKVEPPAPEPPIADKPPVKTEPETIVPPTPKPPKKTKVPKPEKTCSKAPGATLIVAGGLMGGTGIYFRIKAKNIYDNDYLPEYDEPGARDILEDARKPNRMAHMLGAGGVLVAGLGTYLWAKCSKKRKNNFGMENFQLTPILEHNTVTNTNNISARISFNF